jgi:hypothetical protein
MWKEQVIVLFQALSQHFTGGLSKAMKNFKKVGAFAGIKT